MAANPFGKYSDLLTTLVAAFVVVFAVLVHSVPAFAEANSTFVDAAAWIAIGSMFGKVSAANGYANMAVQAHRRLDAIGAPPSSDVQQAANTVG